MKKSAADSNTNKPTKEEKEAVKEENVTSSGLNSLCQLYGSDEDD